MKKHKKKFIFLVTLSFLLITIPYLIDLKFIGTYLEKTVKNEYGLDISIQKTHWYWFPKPGIFLQNTTIKDKAFNSNIKLIAVYPRLISLLKGNISIKEVELITPEINIKSLDKLSQIMPADTGETGGEFPEVILSVSNGILSLPFEGNLAVLKNQIKPLNISIIDLEMNSKSNTMQLTATLETPFASKISSRVQLSRNSPEEPLGNYIWDTLHHANNLDFSQIKKASLLLFGDNEDVYEIFNDIYKCDIKKAGFSFKGTGAQFSNMDNIIATAEVENTDIHIQGTKIVLTDGNGSLRVEEAVLHGSNLTASLKNSFGTNGSFSLGLAEDDFSFKLNFDINADLSELQETIDEFIDPSTLKQELGKVQKLTGRTPVTLKLADDLNDLKTYLFLPSLSGSFHYDLLHRDIKVKDGVLDISPDMITWSNLSFDVGVNEFTGISGSANLQKEALIDITGETAELDSDDVYQIVTSWPKAEKTVNKFLTDIDGKIIISDITVSGPVQNTAAINYDFILHSDAVTVSSSQLPGPATLSFSSVTLSDNKVKTGQVKAKYKDSTLSAAMNLNHRSFDEFNGSVIINGIAGKKLTPWLKEKDWFHQSIFPQLPCRLSPLSLLLSDEAISLSGNIIHDKDINTLVDIKIEDKAGINGSLEILAGKENAVIRLSPPKKKGKGRIKVSFEGKISKATLTSVVDNDWFSGESLEGQFNLLYPVEKNIPIRMNGSAEIKNAYIPLNQNGALLFNSLKIIGNNDFADIITHNATIISPDNLKGTIKEKLFFSEFSSKLYFQYNEAALLRLLSGEICNININGDLKLPSKKLDFKLSLGQKRRVTFNQLFKCLGLKNNNISGDVSVYSEFKGTTENLSGSRMKLKATKGVIKKATLLTKILSLVDLTELFKKNPVGILQATGYNYDDIEIDAVIVGQKLHITRAKINGSGLNLYGTGKIDLKTMDIDMIVLASPLKTIDNLINSIPVIGETMTGDNQSILSVPIKVEGKITDPKIRFIPEKITSVSSGIMDIFVETFKLPFKLVKPIRKQFKKNKE